jgi:hypothetical protein
MATTPQYASTPKVGSCTLSIADTSLTAPTNFGTAFTFGASGSRIDYVEVQGLWATTAAIVNLFIYDGTNYSLWQQIPVQAVTASSTSPSFVYNIASNTIPNAMPLQAPTGYTLRATITASQIAYNASAAGLSVSASVSSGAYAVLNGTVFGTGTGGTGVAASTTAIAAAATVSSTFFTLTTSPYALTAPAQVSLTSSGNQSAITFTIRGLDATGAEISETLAGPNATTVFSANVYSAVTSVYSGATMTGTTSIGYATSCGFPIPAKVTQVSGSTSNTGVTWTIIGINSAGTLVTESLTGAAANTVVTSTNTYRLVSTIKASAAATAASFGTPVIASGVRVIAYGGDF